MKIENIKINGFGNLEEKEIDFSEHINIVHGNNESGKSTLLKFISNIFFGTSKNKKGKEYSDYDKYKPWNSKTFSGKIKYKLDNSDEFEVYREFGGKKNPKIYNGQKEDISKQFTIDKTNGNQFFVEQTGVDETIFLSTVVSMQQEVKLDRNVQNTLLQKVANLASTGDDSVSYKKAQEKINKRQIEEIGTSRSQGRPINIIKEEKFKIQDEIGELEGCKQRKIEIDEEKAQKKEQLIKIEQELENLRKVKKIKDKERLEKEKIKINENLKYNQEQRKKELEKQKEQIINRSAESKEQVKKQEEPKNIKTPQNTKNVALIIFIVIGIIAEIISIFFLKNLIGIILATVIMLFSSLGYFLEYKKAKRNKMEEQKKVLKEEKQKREQEDKLKEDLEKLEAEIKVLEKNINESQKQIQEDKQKILIEKTLEKEELSKEIQKELVETLFNMPNIENEIERKEEEKNNIKLHYNSLELEEKTIKPKLEKVALLEERLEETKQHEAELEENYLAIEKTKEILETAYHKMRQNVTPKLTQELSKNIYKISDGKYSKINLHEQEGIIIEKENGEYIEAGKLSVRNHRSIIFILKACNGKRINTRKHANNIR